MKPETTNTLHPFRIARNAGVPVICYESADPAATIKACIESQNGSAENTATVVFDICNGVRGMNTPGQLWVSAIPDGEKFIGNPSGLCGYMSNNPPRFTPDDSDPVGGIVFLLNGQRFLDDVSTIQAVWNCRDSLKQVGATLCMVGHSFRLPPEIQRDAVIISEPLPEAEELGSILDSICKDAGIEKPTGDDRKTCIDSLLGLSAFEAEQVVALSLRKDGIDKPALWERKVKAIEQTPGLSVYRGHETLADLGGQSNAVELFSKTIRGKLGISCLVFCDELDKGMAASGTDTSGTTQDQLKALLSYIEDQKVQGALLFGPPGTGKSFLCKCLAGEFGIPLIMLDLGALKGSLVGQSEQQMRQALRVIHAISGGKALFLGACNRTTGIPPELLRRFSFLSLFFDLPDRGELDAIWGIQKKAFGLTKAQCDRVDDSGWTGAEIRNCALKAWAMDTKLSEAALSIVPVSRSSSEVVQGLRQSASGKFISASRPGVFIANNTPATAPSATTGRKINQ
jgi:hypothetical protein